jgi:organic radical activating enzyme
MTSTVHAAETNYDESAVGSYTLPGVLAAVEVLEPRHVVVTGGEPMLFADVADLEAAGTPIDKRRVLFMPQGRTPEELAAKTAWLAGECARLGVGLARRHHIEWFGNTRGT